MTVNELRELLDALVEEGLGEATMRVATQPNYPLQSSLAGVCSSRMLAEYNKGETECEDHGWYNCDDCAGDVVEDTSTQQYVWLCEGSQVYDDPYAPRALWSAAAEGVY